MINISRTLILHNNSAEKFLTNRRKKINKSSESIFISTGNAFVDFLNSYEFFQNFQLALDKFRKREF